MLENKEGYVKGLDDETNEEFYLKRFEPITQQRLSEIWKGVTQEADEVEAQGGTTGHGYYYNEVTKEDVNALLGLVLKQEIDIVGQSFSLKQKDKVIAKKTASEEYERGQREALFEVIEKIFSCKE